MGRHRTIDDTELLTIARRVFAAQGHAATTRDVARAAGISQSVLYQRFPSKDDLFFAAMLPDPPDLPTLLGVLDEWVSDGDAHLRGVAGRILAYFEQSMPVVLHLVTHPSFSAATVADLHERVLVPDLIAGLAARMRELAQRGLVAPVDATTAAETLISALHSLAMFAVIREPGIQVFPRERLDQVMDVLWHGFGPRAVSPGSQGDSTSAERPRHG